MAGVSPGVARSMHHKVIPTNNCRVGGWEVGVDGGNPWGQVASPLSPFCPLDWQNLDLSWSKHGPAEFSGQTLGSRWRGNPRIQVASPLSPFCPLDWQNVDLSWSKHG